jgi:hypothetical protein
VFVVICTIRTFLCTGWPQSTQIATMDLSLGGKAGPDLTKLVDRAVASGDIRLDLDPLDLLRALAGVANIGLGPDGEQAAKRLVDILIAGVRMRS